MPLARIVSHYPADAGALSEHLRTLGYEVEIVGPGSRCSRVAEVEMELERVPATEALNYASELAVAHSADIWVTPGVLAIAEGASAAQASTGSEAIEDDHPRSDDLQSQEDSRQRAVEVGLGHRSFQAAEMLRQMGHSAATISSHFGAKIAASAAEGRSHAARGGTSVVRSIREFAHEFRGTYNQWRGARQGAKTARQEWQWIEFQKRAQMEAAQRRAEQERRAELAEARRLQLQQRSQLQAASRATPNSTREERSLEPSPAVPRLKIDPVPATISGAPASASLTPSLPSLLTSARAIPNTEPVVWISPEVASASIPQKIENMPLNGKHDNVSAAENPEPQAQPRAPMLHAPLPPAQRPAAASWRAATVKPKLTPVSDSQTVRVQPSKPTPVLHPQQGRALQWRRAGIAAAAVAALVVLGFGLAVRQTATSMLPSSHLADTTVVEQKPFGEAESLRPVRLSSTANAENSGVGSRLAENPTKPGHAQAKPNVQRPAAKPRQEYIAQDVIVRHFSQPKAPRTSAPQSDPTVKHFSDLE